MIVLAIGSHPDDVELGCGGTLARHARDGNAVHMFIMTSGDGGKAPVKTRKEEARDSAKVLGARSIRFGGLSAYEFSMVKQKYVEIIEKEIARVKPDRVYSHTRHDKHQNHEMTAKCVAVAARDVAELISFELPSTNYDFRPNMFIDISATMDRKLDCLAMFESQQDKLYMDPKNIESRARTKAVEARMDMSVAEAFCIERLVVR